MSPRYGTGGQIHLDPGIRAPVREQVLTRPAIEEVRAREAFKRVVAPQTGKGVVVCGALKRVVAAGAGTNLSWRSAAARCKDKVNRIEIGEGKVLKQDRPAPCARQIEPHTAQSVCHRADLTEAPGSRAWRGRSDPRRRESRR